MIMLCVFFVLLRICLPISDQRHEHYLLKYLPKLKTDGFNFDNQIFFCSLFVDMISNYFNSFFYLIETVLV